MTLPLNIAMLRGAYDYLASSAPFSKWNMPDGDDVTFRVIRAPSCLGQYYRDKKNRHVIAISSRVVGHTFTLLTTMAHEMVHLYQAQSGMENAAQHNRAFLKLALRVCKLHGFDPKAF